MKLPSFRTIRSVWISARRFAFRVRTGTGPLTLASRAGLALAVTLALLAVRVWLMLWVTLAVREHQFARARALPAGRPAARARSGAGTRSTRLTGRGGVIAVFGACFLGLLIADWADWAELADAVFFMASSLTAYYVRRGSLLTVAVSPPLLFFAAIILEKLVIASGMLAALSGIVVALADAAPWLFAGTALTVIITMIRGLPRELRALLLDLRTP